MFFGTDHLNSKKVNIYKREGFILLFYCYPILTYFPCFAGRTNRSANMDPAKATIPHQKNAC